MYGGACQLPNHNRNSKVCPMYDDHKKPVGKRPAAAGGQGGAGGDAIGGGDRLDPAMYVSVNVTKASTVGEVLAAVRGKVAEGRWGAQLEGGEGDGGGGGDGDGKARRYDLQLTEIASFECVASNNSDEAELAKTMDVLSKVRESCTLSFTFNVAKYVLVTL